MTSNERRTVVKDFDPDRAARRISEEHRQFKLRGEVFTRRDSVRPEVIASFDAIKEGTPPSEVIRIIDQTVVDLLDDADGGHDRYRATREQEDDPVTLDDLNALAQWLVEELTGRPTSPPSPSAPGPSETGTLSTADFSLPEELMAQPV